MADGHLGVFDPAVVSVGDDEDVLTDVGEAAALRTDERDRVEAIRISPLHRLDEVGRVAADAHAEREVAGLSVVLELAEKDILEGVVVAERGHPGGVVVERQNAESLPKGVRGTLADIGHKVSCIRRTAAIAEDEDLRPLAVGIAEKIDDPRDLIERERRVDFALFGNVVLKPVIERLNRVIRGS